MRTQLDSHGVGFEMSVFAMFAMMKRMFDRASVIFGHFLFSWIYFCFALNVFVLVILNELDPLELCFRLVRSRDTV
jgi:hypothetical protein